MTYTELTFLLSTQLLRRLPSSHSGAILRDLRWNCLLWVDAVEDLISPNLALKAAPSPSLPLNSAYVREFSGGERPLPVLDVPGLFKNAAALSARVVLNLILENN